jgi:hypothetical protein
MKPLEARSALRAKLVDQALDPELLDPWPAWRVFKQFLRDVEVEGVYDAAAVIVEPEEDGTTLFLVRQFSIWEDGEYEDESEDVPAGRVVVEFRYEACQLPENEVWTLDYPTLEEWASVVEGALAFQTLINRTPRFTDVYFGS